MRFTVLVRAASTLMVAISGAGCATAGSSYQSGVGDKLIEHPPYYAGRTIAADSGRIGHFPVLYQRGSTQSPLFEPEGGRGTPMAALVAEMNAYLDSLGISTRVAATRAGTPPDVRFGCEEGLIGGECLDRGEGALGRNELLKLEVRRPSADWITAAKSAMDSAGVARALVISLEVGDYFVRQRGLAGRKEVELGTGYTVDFPWLTSLETPVTVLQLTGALIGPDGKAIRIGAEGLYARRTRLILSALGGQELLGDEDVEKLRTARREELAGKPLVWQVALRNLVAQLTGREALVAR
ncbi:MAG TPA: hypothetical protein VJ672_08400 [Gemmatimonadaceae bacterium]|nr:hypothetical protein [Gemmatimonadaceae bacterium]